MAAATLAPSDRTLLALPAAGLLLWTALHYPPLTLGLVVASLGLAVACFWSCSVLAGVRSARIFLITGALLGWLAEEAGSTMGWLFGHYTYTDVLGPRLGSVPLVIPLMWFGLCHVGWVLASLILWRQPVHASAKPRSWALAAVLCAMIVTAFDLGADPWFVYGIKAWIMAKKDGHWFGETIKGFEGWLLVSLAITLAFQIIARPAPAAPAPGVSPARLHFAALVPVLIYASLIVFQVCFTTPVALKVIAFFAMGIPALAAWSAWQKWAAVPGAAPAAPVRDPVSAARWDAAMRSTDPLADDTVAALIGPWSDASGATGPGTVRLGQATRLMAGWTSNGSLAGWTAPAGSDPDVARALQAYVRRGRCLPEWADRARVERAERIFMDYGPLSCTLLFCASLPQCYVMPELARVLHAAGQLEEHTEHRIRQTAAMVFPVMMRGGLMHEDGAGVAQVLKVRLIHATIRHLILRANPQQAEGRVAALDAPGPRASLHQALAAHGWDIERQGMPCSQLELAYTLLTFSYVFLDGLRTLGLGLDTEDEEACLHAWNVMGHVLGIEEDLMAHTMAQARAMFSDLQSRAFAQPAAADDPRPALGRALMGAMAATLRVPAVRELPVPLTRWLIGARAADAIGVGASVGLVTRALFWLARIGLQSLDGIVRLVLPRFSIARMLTRAVGYHLLTRLLLSQTRSLGLPAELLEPLQQTVAGWHHDPHAPGWVNRWEDRLTSTGAWTAPAAAARADTTERTHAPS